MVDPIPIPGWFPEESRATLDALIETHAITSVVEIGSFLGLSAVWFARHPQIQTVHCVDLWMEPATHANDNNLVGTLDTWDLPRDFFPLFRDNVMRSGYWHKIHPIKGHSRYCYGEVPEADLIYIDGDHTAAGATADIGIYWRKARRILCGDDYVEREGFGVIEAVRKEFPRASHNGPLWWAEILR